VQALQGFEQGGAFAAVTPGSTVARALSAPRPWRFALFQDGVSHLGEGPAAVVRIGGGADPATLDEAGHSGTYADRAICAFATSSP
jgi:hypothetical protein